MTYIGVLSTRTARGLERCYILIFIAIFLVMISN